MARKPDLEKRRQLVQDAFAVVSRRGAHNTTMKDLAAELGMARSSLYWYFGDLGDVFEGVLERTFDDVRLGVQDLFSLENPIDVLEELLKTLTVFHAERRETIIVMFQLWAAGKTDPDTVLGQGATFLEMLRSTLTQLVESGQQQGMVSEVDAAALVDATLCFIDGALVQRIVRGPDADLHPMIDLFITHVLTPARTSA